MLARAASVVMRSKRALANESITLIGLNVVLALERIKYDSEFFSLCFFLPVTAAGSRLLSGHLDADLMPLAMIMDGFRATGSRQGRMETVVVEVS